MASVQFLQLGPVDLMPAGGALAEHVTVGLGSGLGFPRGQASSVLFAARVPEVVTLSTGLTVTLLVADDPNNTGPGLVAVFGVTVGPLTSGTSKFDETALTSSTEATGSVTISATAGVLTIAAIAVPIASMNSLAAGGWCLIRIRRLGLSASDTHRGRVVVLGVDVRNT